ncbi:antirestriction protein [Candidatus Termititenax aidoneus]|uniref:Antirestriction protein n=1 Tax=Termititenax aidoneus TaxID=2218524 RepID=A0A388T924_TERA1|nr:antirestriction protein [Candidatus Termititenax aidoneus]
MTIAQEKQQAIVEELIKGLELGVIPWQNPCAAELPKNLQSNKTYRGINYLYLTYIANKKSYKHNIWGTFLQIKNAGGSVNCGEKSVPVIYWTITEKEVTNKNGLKEVKEIPILRYYNVFNIEQTNMKLPEKQHNNFNPIEKAEGVIKANNPNLIVSVSGNYYIPSEDTIYIQKPETFINTNEYYGVTFHELSHWTGNAKRLNRPLESLNKDRNSYSQEELIAEMASSFIMQELGLPINKTNTQAYINNWANFLKNQKEALVSASSKASKAADYIFGRKLNEGAGKEVCHEQR